jgi:hypothetical protein
MTQYTITITNVLPFRNEQTWLSILLSWYRILYHAVVTPEASSSGPCGARWSYTEFPKSWKWFEESKQSNLITFPYSYLCSSYLPRSTNFSQWVWKSMSNVSGRGSKTNWSNCWSNSRQNWSVLQRPLLLLRIATGTIKNERNKRESGHHGFYLTLPLH